MPSKQQGYLITPYDPAIEDELKAGRQFMKDYRDTFKELARSGCSNLAGSARKPCCCCMRKVLPNSAVRAAFETRVCLSLRLPARNAYAYNPAATIAELAASYGYGVAKNHAFVDGNKRAAFLSIGLFLAINGYRLTASQVDAIETVLAVAAGTVAEPALALWIAQHHRNGLRIVYPLMRHPLISDKSGEVTIL